MVALYQAMVDPLMQLPGQGAQAATVTPLKGKVELAKKFRRSSMLKQAAAVRELQRPVQATGVAALLQPATLGMGKQCTQASSSSASSAAVPGRAAISAGLPPQERTPQKASLNATGAEGGKRLVKKTARPAVPLFQSPGPAPLSALQLLRQTPLSPKHQEENYEIS